MEPRRSNRQDQRHPRNSVHNVDDRDPFQHDRDRILYSSAFRRLGRVSQVVSPTERQLLHNRLTHSLEVAQIGRGLARTLQRQPGSAESIRRAGGLSGDVVEAAALAHDLGHPPFGHVAEKELDRLLRGDNIRDGFEGNAQSFRIVTKLATRYSDVEGLNLTRATLRAILKYPWTWQTDGKASKKWGAYFSEREDLEWAMQLQDSGVAGRSLEAALMDWADDIAYAIHDMEDFYRAGLIPLDRLTTDRTERDRFLTSQIAQLNSELDEPEESIERAFEDIIAFAPFSSAYFGTKFDRAALRSFTSQMIHRYINSVAIDSEGAGEFALRIKPDARREVAILKRLTWHYVINSRELNTQRFGQRALIRSLYDVFKKAATSDADWYIFPHFYRDQLVDANHEARLRLVADVISSMNETQAIEMNQRLTGQSLGFALDRPNS